MRQMFHPPRAIMLPVPSPEECVNRFAKLDLDAGSREYLRFHARRYSYLVAKVLDFANQSGATCRILDVGPSFQTALFRDALPLAIINTLGHHDVLNPLRAGEQHFALDLNDTQYPDRCPQPSVEHDLIVMAEVIEHLYTAPQLVLHYVAGWLKPGGTLLLQTPNAVCLAKRILMVRGRNPFEMIRDQRVNPGHFREYTLSELREAALKAGLLWEGAECRNYFGIPRTRTRVYDVLCAFTPGLVRDGITAWLRKAPR